MDYFQFEKLVFERQSCRDFNGKAVDKETMEKIADLSRFSPSACNSQPWQMYCVNSEETKQKVKKALTYLGRNSFLEKAGGFICLVEKARPLKPEVESKFGPSFFIKYDVGELIAYITLTAHTLGVKSCIIGWMDHDKLAEALGLSDKEKCYIVVALGYSDSPIREKKRRDREETVKII